MRVNMAAYQSVLSAVSDYLMTKSGGEPFLNFRHSTFREEEVNYKRRAHTLAHEDLRTDQWRQSLDSQGEVLTRVAKACDPGISRNLLNHRYGQQKPLRLARERGRVGALELEIVELFESAQCAPIQFGQAFDRFCSFLKAERLGCSWRFVTYLCFLANPERYFPVLPSRVDPLLAYLGLRAAIAGIVEWHRYEMVLELADWLKERLSFLGEAGPIEMQSFMWIAGSLLGQAESVIPVAGDPDFESLMRQRQGEAANRERIGLSGERYVFLHERETLRTLRRPDLAARVSLVSATQTSLGYDVLSFRPDGIERHIEVKTSERSRTGDHGFWLTRNEYEMAETDEHWCLYRVWGISRDPAHEDLGNIVRGTFEGWAISASQFRVHPVAQVERSIP